MLGGAVSSTSPHAADDARAHQETKTRSPGEAAAASSELGHVDIFSYVMLELAMLVLIAVIGRWIAGRVSQPPVLGELGIGMLIGNVGYWLGIPVCVLIMHMGEAGQVITQALETNVAVGQLASDLAQAGQIDSALAGLLAAVLRVDGDAGEPWHPG